MKSANERRAWWTKWWIGAGSVGLFAGFVACGGVDESRSSRHGGDAGDSAQPEAGAPGESAGGSSAHGGSSAPGAAGEGSGGVGGDAGPGNQAGGSGVGEAGQSAGGAPVTPGGGEAGSTDLGEAGASGGGGDGGAAGAGPGDPVVDPVCGVGMAQVGAVSEWCGKVNVHLVGSSWLTDTDCTSGCRNNDAERLAYCKKFYPKTASIVRGLDQKASGTKDWKNAGCADSYPDGPGISGEFACCALVP